MVKFSVTYNYNESQTDSFTLMCQRKFSALLVHHYISATAIEFLDSTKPFRINT